jgi:rhodanese-related sulfurtransferase
VALVLGLASVSRAADTPTSLSGVTMVTAERARQAMEKGAVVLDVRVANEYAEAHVKGAKSVPYKEKSLKSVDFDAAQDSFDLSKLPSDKSAPIVTYCNGPECWKSYKAAKAAAQAGYKQIYWLRGGLPEWKRQGYPVE